MMMKRTIISVVSGMFLLCMVSQAQAIPVTYSVTFQPLAAGSGTLAGTIEIDTDLGMPLTAFNLTSYGGVDPNNNPVGTTNYMSGVSTVNFNSLALSSITQGNNTLLLTYAPSLMGGQVGNFGVVATELYQFGTPAQTTGRTAFTVTTPEPSAILLFGSGLLGLGLWGYRKQRKS